MCMGCHYIFKYKYKYTRFLRNVLKYIPSTLQIVLKYTKYCCPALMQYDSMMTMGAARISQPVLVRYLLASP